MKAVDTNILARYVTQDDPVQARIAEEILQGPCFVSDTVLLETAWLLASHYGMDRHLLAATLIDLISLPLLTVSDRLLVGWAIERFSAGADLADMMHIIGGRHTDAFVSFERRLAWLAGDASPVRVERPA